LIANDRVRNRHLDGVSGIGSGGPDLPHRAPVAVVDAVGNAGISQGADRGGLEVVRVPPIEERVQHNAEVVVLGDGAAVAAEFVGDDRLFASEIGQEAAEEDDASPEAD